MEGLGFLAAVYANQNVNAMVVRGISNLVEGKEEADQKGSQALASKNAAEFAFELLAGLNIHPKEASSPSKIFNVLHPRNPLFTGRDSYLKELRDSLQSGDYAALTQAIGGLGGVTKTQLAIEYAYRFRDDYDVVWWIHSDTAEILSSQYTALADALSLMVENPAQKKEAVRTWLETQGGWLLIFDNVNTITAKNNLERLTRQ